ncbi:TetR/AcrR family transcriptional regulator [Streptomyces cavernicola]|uniref:TetR/AcrR family transcriptional regulator n=1 Tax=Streptomyces cavernicola TaxID=3043613 RepID=A0ABT6SE20_9ACTN|nr:TetR/AcrR family transcriptional regulator [Streptomyces sp. B-S-A6]MDI3406431.1 TetR/AcrR family transcriptional regulator [Streptomyces sp. B-S-A6]
MADRKQRIAGDLERSFAEQGFAEQGVGALRADADVSLRTLYKYFPSRESMIVGALEHRDRAYFEWLAGGPADGVEHVLYPLVRLGDWLAEVANTGCLFLNALAEYPNSEAIAATVTAHKERLAEEFRRRLQEIAPDRDTGHLAETLFLLHEGMTQAARLQGREKATKAALRAARAALSAEGIL